MRKKYSPKQKAKVAISAIQGEKTMAELSSSYEIHRDQIQKWKKVVLEGAEGLFGTSQSRNPKENEKLIDELYRQIGQLKVENEWLKKKV